MMHDDLKLGPITSTQQRLLIAGCEQVPLLQDAQSGVCVSSASIVSADVTTSSR